MLVWEEPLTLQDEEGSGVAQDHRQWREKFLNKLKKSGLKHEQVSKTNTPGTLRCQNKRACVCTAAALSWAGWLVLLKLSVTCYQCSGACPHVYLSKHTNNDLCVKVKLFQLKSGVTLPFKFFIKVQTLFLWELFPGCRKSYKGHSLNWNTGRALLCLLKSIFILKVEHFLESLSQKHLFVVFSNVQFMCRCVAVGLKLSKYLYY